MCILNRWIQIMVCLAFVVAFDVTTPVYGQAGVTCSPVEDNNDNLEVFTIVTGLGSLNGSACTAGPGTVSAPFNNTTLFGTLDAAGGGMDGVLVASNSRNNGGIGLSVGLKATNLVATSGGTITGQTLICPGGTGDAITCTLQFEVGGNPFHLVLTKPAGSNTATAAPIAAGPAPAAEADIDAQRTSRIIRNFIAGRQDVIVSNDPQIFERLSGGGGGGEGNLAGFAAQGEGGNYTLSFHTSVQAMYAEANRKRTESLAEIKQALAVAGENVLADEPERVGFDIWAKGKYVRARNAARRSDVGLLYLGGDYRFSQDLVAGVLAQMDWTDEHDRSANSKVKGFGWLAGPYVVARLTRNLIFDARAAAGTSDNEVSPLGTFQDDFDTTRFLIRGQLTGDFTIESVIFNPFVQLLYLTEKQYGYTDSLGNRIPSQTLSLGRFKFGPKVSTQLQTESGAVISPHLTFSGLYDFDRARQINAQGLTVNSSRIRGRVEGGMGISLPNGVQLNGEGFYDGIGAGRLDSYGGSVSVRVPLN